MATAETFGVMWLVDEEKGITLVDACNAWLERKAAEDPRLARALPAALEAGRKCVYKWNLAFDERVRNLRDAERERGLVGSSMLSALDATGRFARGVLDGHETFSVFLSANDLKLTRWQRWMVICTMILTALLVSIWFYSSRAFNCCSEARAHARSLCLSRCEAQREALDARQGPSLLLRS